MANFSRISLLNPIKFIKVSSSPGVNFDDDWACNRVKSWQRKVYYFHKWRTGHETRLQMVSTIIPDKLKILSMDGTVLHDIGWDIMTAVPGNLGNIYELTLNMDIVGTEKKVALYQLVTNGTGGSYNVAWISEPIHISERHKNLSVVKYKHFETTQSVYFPVTGIEFTTLQESQLFDFQPDYESSEYYNQTHDSFLQYGVPFRSFKLLIGNTPGVADHEPDLWNRIFCCSSVRHNGLLISRVPGAKLEPTRNKEYPLAGWALDVVESVNQDSSEFNDVDPLIPGFINAYEINEDLTGQSPSGTLQILDKKTT